MRRILIAGAALMLGAAPMAVHAQEMTVEMTEAQQADYDGWSPAKKGEFATWPVSYQTYYWTLTPTQQDAYWTLTVEQRAQIAAMSPMQQQQAWSAIESQFAANSAAGTVDPVYIMRDNAVVQQAPPPHNGEYPLCTDGRTDNCINPREAGKNFGNVPLDYCPGEPASQMSAQEKMQADDNM